MINVQAQIEDTMCATNKVLGEILSKRRSTHQLRIEQLLLKIREHGNLPDLPSRPKLPDLKIVLKQLQLIMEEAFELFEACGAKVWLQQDAGVIPVNRHDLEMRIDADMVDTLDHIAKEIADLSVVNTGLFTELGISDVAVLEEVDVNNLAKFGPGGFLDENFKWRKPPNHPVPDIKRILMAQGWSNPEVSNEKVETAGLSISHSGNGQEGKTEATSS
jgi:predicted HAD superfamily Cof-like phosphohydrolase